MDQSLARRLVHDWRVCLTLAGGCMCQAYAFAAPASYQSNIAWVLAPAHCPSSRAELALPRQQATTLCD